jgi:DNA modification methylase
MRGVLEELGYADALIAREVNGGLQLIDGHLRAETTPDTEVPVLVVDLDQAEADMLLATLDPLAAMAQADKENLDAVLRSVDTGNEAIQEMLSDLAKENKLYDTEEVEEDEAPEPPEEAATNPGDLWLLGEHRLLCGDSTKEEDVARLMNGEKAALFAMNGEKAALFATDPPYLVDYDGLNHPQSYLKTREKGPRAGTGQPLGNRDWSPTYGEVKWDTDKDIVGFYETYCRAAIQCAIKPNAAWYCWHASRHQAKLEQAWVSVGAFHHQQILWVKTRAVLTRSVYLWQHEPCMFGWIKGNKPAIRKNYPEGEHPTTVWQIASKEVETDEHPTSKPIKVFSIPIRMHTERGDVCYEPFSGSGSQLIAAEQLNRRCFGLEIEPRYCDVIVQRWEALTGQKARLA